MKSFTEFLTEATNKNIKIKERTYEIEGSVRYISNGKRQYIGFEIPKSKRVFGISQSVVNLILKSIGVSVDSNINVESIKQSTVKAEAINIIDTIKEYISKIDSKEYESIKLIVFDMTTKKSLGSVVYEDGKFTNTVDMEKIQKDEDELKTICNKLWKKHTITELKKIFCIAGLSETTKVTPTTKFFIQKAYNVIKNPNKYDIDSEEFDSIVRYAAKAVKANDDCVKQCNDMAFVDSSIDEVVTRFKLKTSL